MSLRVLDLLTLTYQSLRSNPLRSLLTTLSMFMGVAAVTATLNVRNISQAVLTRELAKRDAPQVLLGVRWGPRRQLFALRADELDFLRPRLPQSQAMAAVNWISAGTVFFEDQSAQPSAFAVSQDFLQADGNQLRAGRYFNATDYHTFRPVVVIDQFLVDRLFAGRDPLGKQILLRQRPFRVVGVIPTRTADTDPRGELHIPLAIYSAMTGDQTVDSIQVRTDDLLAMEALGNQAKALLQQNRPGRKLWTINNVEDILEQQKTLNMTSKALTAVAVISLLIGGVGIANVMIAAVTERTPEIGLRRAIGATQRDVMTQFILEAASLSVLGGAIALGTVHLGTQAIAQNFDLPYEFEMETGAIAIGAAVLVGIGAGLPPAIRASHLDPIKALRTE